jgi:hypothetical protein
MAIAYNEALFENVAVAYQLPPVSKAATFNIGPVLMMGVDRVAFVIEKGVDTGTPTWTPKLQCCSTSGGTYVDLQIGSGALAAMSTSATQMSVYEFRSEAIQVAIDASASTTKGQFVQLAMTLSGTTSSIIGAQVLVTTAKQPAMNIKANPFYLETTIGTAVTTPILPKANYYVDGNVYSDNTLPY